MKKIFLILPIFILGCMSSETKVNKGIKLQLLTIGALDSSELFSEEMFQIFEPITFSNNDTIINAFDESYTINITRLDLNKDSNISIVGESKIWDLQLFGKPKPDKLKELAYSNFEGIIYNPKLTKINNSPLCELKQKQIDYIKLMENKSYTILIYDSSNFIKDTFLNKFYIYNSYSKLKKGIIENFSKKKTNFLIVHKIAYCDEHIKNTTEEEPPIPIIKETSIDGPYNKIKNNTPNNPEVPARHQLGDISYNKSIVFFDKCDECFINIIITKIKGASTPIQIKNYSNNSLNIREYNLLPYEEYNIKIEDEFGITKNICVVPLSNSELCSCSKNH